MALAQEYLDLTQKYKAEYGPKTIVLMEVGSFFEVYALQAQQNQAQQDQAQQHEAHNEVHEAHDEAEHYTETSYTGSNIEDFAKINEMVIAKKNVFIGKAQVVMAGVGTAHADKYIQKMQDHGYTIVIYRQDLQNKTSRSLTEIISPGTYFPLENDIGGLSNNIMCIWLYKSKLSRQMVVGLANIDIYTGKTALFQYQTPYNHSPATYDELERYVAAYRPSECLMVANINERLMEEVRGFVGLEQTKIHIVANEVASANEVHNAVHSQGALKTFAKNAEKQIYQVEILKKFFPQLTSFPDQFPTHSIAIQAFCLLLDFVYQHSPNLVKKLTEPVFENYTDRLILANHSLNQLNIIDDARHTGKLKSVSSLLNNCVTTMGKRQFMYNLHYPSTQPATLQASYDITEHLLAQGEAYFLYIRQKLSAVSDLEKFARKMVIRKVQPKNLAVLADDLREIGELYTYLEKDSVLNVAKGNHITNMCRTITADLARVFNLDLCRALADISEPSPLIQRGISPVLDELLQTSVDGGDKLEAICNYLSSLIQQSEKKPAKVPARASAQASATATTYAYVKLHETAKSHAVLVCTSRRTELLKEAINKSTIEITYTSNYSQQTETFTFDLAALEYLPHGNSKTEKIITSRQIREMTSENEEVKGKLVREMNLVFQNYITAFAKYDTEIQALIHYVTEMDILQGKAYTAHKYNYCKPVLIKAPKAFFRFTGLRHPLIEHLQTNELYVTNDLALGQETAASEAASEAANDTGTGTATNGILLYGTNAVGKTSFIKSVGIAVIMAQAGLYVPCQSFTYSPYQQLFTRILGNDNLFKGLSTFAVEMTELRTILTQANAHSLVLGDELCSGTESDSALSIFTAGLEILHEKESTFLFATHFHEINKYAEITALTKMKMMHMAVHYNKATNLLIYDRKLRDGPGESMYGLEVCKSLNLPEAFLQRAHDIRLKYHPEKQNILSLSPTHFNAKKLVTNCEICLEQKASEVHHLQHQKKADKKNEYITTESGESFHKNHVANLLNICEACHKTIHKAKAEHKVVKTSEGYVLAKIK